MKPEMWKIYPDNPNYEVSSFGKIRRLYKNHKRYLSPTILRDGYLYVTISSKGKSKQIPIHRLVATTFLEKGEDKTQVNHKNGNKMDNRVCNLEWVTASENIKHAYKMGLIAPPHMKKVRCVETGQVFISLHEAERKTGVCFANISACCRKRLKTAGGWHWSFKNEA